MELFETLKVKNVYQFYRRILSKNLCGHIENPAYAVFLSGDITLRECPITSHYCRESSDFIGHCLKAMTPDKNDRIGRIFDMA